ncbi:MAG: protein arginine kinase [Elusimicrobia bacterium]|nr:protein arginine kinase [Elusimicrobiota bacterium]
MQLQKMLDLRIGWAQEGEESAIVLSSRVRLARNLDKTLFPSHAPETTLKETLEKIFAAARRAALERAAYLKLSDLDAVDLRFLVERHLISPNHAALPRQRGVVVGAGETVSLMVNEEDHIRLACLQPGLNLKEAFAQANALDDALSESLPFAFREDWGYLTACPTNLGTGLRASALVHLPGLGLSGQTNQLLENLSRAGLIARGLYGEGTQIMGDLFQIANATCLGRTEAEILAALDEAVSRLAEKEAEARQALSSGNGRARLEDIVYRSLGILSQARLLSFEEACQHLSALRLGLGLGWKLPAGITAVNELLILSQPAHLQMRADKELGPGERDFLRAALIRERLAR